MSPHAEMIRAGRLGFLAKALDANELRMLAAAAGLKVPYGERRQLTAALIEREPRALIRRVQTKLDDALRVESSVEMERLGRG